MDRKVAILAFIVGLSGKQKANTQSLEGLMAEGLIFTLYFATYILPVALYFKPQACQILEVDQNTGLNTTLLPRPCLCQGSCPTLKYQSS